MKKWNIAFSFLKMDRSKAGCRQLYIPIVPSTIFFFHKLTFSIAIWSRKHIRRTSHSPIKDILQVKHHLLCSLNASLILFNSDATSSIFGFSIVFLFKQHLTNSKIAVPWSDHPESLDEVRSGASSSRVMHCVAMSWCIPLCWNLWYEMSFFPVNSSTRATPKQNTNWGEHQCCQTYGYGRWVSEQFFRSMCNWK